MASPVWMLLLALTSVSHATCMYETSVTFSLALPVAKITTCRSGSFVRGSCTRRFSSRCTSKSSQLLGGHGANVTIMNRTKCKVFNSLMRPQEPNRNHVSCRRCAKEGHEAKGGPKGPPPPGQASCHTSKLPKGFTRPPAFPRVRLFTISPGLRVSLVPSSTLEKWETRTYTKTGCFLPKIVAEWKIRIKKKGKLCREARVGI